MTNCWLGILLGLLIAQLTFAQNPNTANYPGALADDATLTVANDAVETTLDGALTATAMTINVVSAAALTAFPVSCWVDNEVVKILSKSTNALTVATDCASGTCATCSPTTDCRGWGYASTTEASHLTAATFTCAPTANAFNAAWKEIIATQTALGVNLVNVVEPADINTFAELDAIVADQTLVHSNSNIATASALAANGGNCSAGSYPLGVDAAGAVESCTDASTETDSIVATHAAIATAHHTATVDSHVNIEENDVSVQLDALALDFLGADFDLSTAASEVEVVIAAAITRTADINTFSELDAIVADQALVHSGSNIATATALAANGGNCAAGSYPLGVDASGATESCTDASTETDSIVATHAAIATAHHTATVKLTQEEVEDFAGPLVATGGTKTRITVTYQDGTGDMDFVVAAEVNDLEIEGAASIATTEIPIGTGPGTVTYAPLSGDAVMDNAGVVTVANLETLAGTLDVPSGGTGVTAPTDGGIVLGSGSGPFTSLGVAANGEIPIGDGATDPVLATITGGTEITVVNGPGTITINGDYTPSSVDTNTNKTQDAEATGNNFTEPIRIMLRAGGVVGGTAAVAWNTAASGHCEILDKTAGGFLIAAVACDKAADESIGQFTTKLPPVIDVANVDLIIQWYGETLAVNEVTWAVRTACLAATGEAIADLSWNATKIVTSTASGTADDWASATIDNVPMTNCAGGETLWVEPFRDADASEAGADDDFDEDANFVQAELIIRVTK